MIATLTGKVTERTSGAVIVDVGGVGYLVHISTHTSETLPKTGEVTLHTYLAVRENAHELYGFADTEEKHFFELLLGVPGIGPKSALAVLSLASVSALRTSITAGDTTYLTKVSGIGKKMAEKIVLELRDKLGAETGDSTHLKEDTDAIEALQTLGYGLKESREALEKVSGDVTGASERVREALKLFGKK